MTTNQDETVPADQTCQRCRKAHAEFTLLTEEELINCCGRCAASYLRGTTRAVPRPDPRKEK